MANLRAFIDSNMATKNFFDKLSFSSEYSKPRFLGVSGLKRVNSAHSDLPPPPQIKMRVHSLFKL